MTFERIYRDNAWRGDDSLSGPGSGVIPTTHVVEDILALVDELRIVSVVDVACGDGRWMPDLPGYIGVDVSETAIRRAKAAHPDRAYIRGDIRELSLPTVDLVIARDVIQHLSYADGLSVLGTILTRIRPRWLLASTYMAGGNVDIPTGEHYSPDLTAPPFSLPVPVRTIFDGYTYHDGDAVRDPSKVLGLWRLRR